MKEYEETALSSELLGMIGTITGSNTMIGIAEKGEENMCKALDEYWNKAKEEGEKVGREAGEKTGRILERIEMGRELQVPDEVLMEQLMKKFEFTREIVMEYMQVV